MLGIISESTTLGQIIEIDYITTFFEVPFFIADTTR